MDVPDTSVAWVVRADDPGLARRARRRIRAWADVTAETELPGGYCVQTRSAEPGLEFRLRRVLGHAPELRMDCDVAHFPLGRGWLVVFLEPPAPDLDATLDLLGLPFSQVARSSDGVTPITVCTTRAAVVDPSHLQADLTGAGQVVRSIYEVGGCERDAVAYRSR